MPTDTVRLVQLFHPEKGRRVASVQEPELTFLNATQSVYDLALNAVQENKNLIELIQTRLTSEQVDYDTVYQGENSWKLMPAFDHPAGPLGCMVSGTGLTHKNSALNRQMMHQAGESKLTDSMQMYQWGLAGGWPAAGAIGVQPEWFYKGNGSVLKAHGQALTVPAFANDGGEEPEIAGVYLIDPHGQPWRIGFTTGNEFSDHVMEKKNYLYLAPSKLRDCAIGPELVIDAAFADLSGTVQILRDKAEIWSKHIRTGEQNMAHSLQNLEYHHFKYPGHRVPGQAHVHFFGADAFSFGEQVQLQAGDKMAIQWAGLGRALINPLEIIAAKEDLIPVKPMATQK
jgi:hypothetical protein